MRLGWRLRVARGCAAALWAIAALLASASSAAVADVLYSYDAAGRVIQVVDPSGESAQYIYDAAGNIVQIIRVPAGNVAIAGFTPKSGPIGTAVTIFGAGFSATPANNTVQFNGVGAAVTSAAVNQLVATVPASATTGTISVTVGAQTATSAESFSVTTASGGPPTISGFTPDGGPPGTVVTISGTNFDPILLNNTVRFNVGQAAVTASAATEITANVPTYAGSGPITVKTLYGIAQSADDFVVPPAGYAYADIISRARVAIDGTAGSLAISTSNKLGIVLFEGAAGDYVSLHLSSLSVSPVGNVAYKVFDPTNVEVAAGNVSSTAMSIHVPGLKRAGSYTILFSPGAATASLSFALTRNPVLSAALPTVNATISVAGQSARAVYTGTGATAMTLRLAITSTNPANQTVSMSAYKPDGTQLATTSGSSSTDGGAIYVASLPVSGKYGVVLSPSNAATGSISVTLNPAMDIEADAAQVSVSNSTAGYAKRVLFSGTAGQHLGFGLTGLSYVPSGGGVTTAEVFKPDGTSLVWNTCATANPGGYCRVNPGTMPVTGTYTLVLTPPAATSFSGTLALSSAVTGSLTTGTPLNAGLSRPGQWARLTFAGTAAQLATVMLDGTSTTPAGQNVSITVLSPSGSQVGTIVGSSSTDGGLLHVPSLPATGDYVVRVEPWYGSTGTVPVTLNPSMDLVVDAAPSTLATTTAGSTKRFLFEASASQNMGIGTTGHVHTPGSGASTALVLYRPDGTQVASTNCSTSGLARCQLNLISAQAGPYTLAVTPPASVNFSGTVALSNPVTGSLTIGGSSSAVALQRDGQDGWYTFSGTASQLLRLNLTGMSTTPSGQVGAFVIVRPDGTQLAVFTTTNSSASFDIPALDATGTHVLWISPWFGVQSNMNVSISTR